jgi:hypothetical protein
MTFSANVTAVTGKIGAIPSAAHKTLNCSTYAVGKSVTCFIAGLNSIAIGSGVMAYITLAYTTPAAGQSTSVFYSNPQAVDVSGIAETIELYYTLTTQFPGGSWVSQR